MASKPDAEISDEHRRATLLRLALQLSDEDPAYSEDERDALIDEWDRLCPHPCSTDIIFWPDQLGLCRSDELSTFQMTAQQMVEYAMTWAPRVVAMQVKQRSGGRSVGYYLYNLVAPDTPNTQVVTGLDSVYEKGATLAVALKGVRLNDGTTVERLFDFGAASCGKILGVTDKAIGTVIAGANVDT